MIVKLGKGGRKATIDRTAPIVATDPTRLREAFPEARSSFGREVGVGVHVAVVESDSGEVCLGVKLTCDRCKRSRETIGTTGRSVRRGLAELREHCPMDERNFYVTVPPEESQDDPADEAPAARPGGRYDGGRGSGFGSGGRGGARRTSDGIAGKKFSVRFGGS